MKILLVEDHEEIWDFLSRRLRKRNYVVEVATDGAAGVRAAVAMRPDVILLDMTLPVLSGWTAAGLMKAAPSLRRTPILALTAHTLPGDEQRTRQAGCDGFVPKPIDFEGLCALIESYRPGAARAA